MLLKLWTDIFDMPFCLWICPNIIENVLMLLAITNIQNVLLTNITIASHES